MQPTSSPFETPCIPCLTYNGFVRWQTLQLLLSPGESVDFLQKAVELYRIPRRDGGYFPARIPKECFPTEPDEAMEKWYTTVTETLNQNNYMRRLKASPYQSPYPDERKEGYFQNGGPSRNSSSEDHQSRLDSYRRRSSVPDAVSPIAVPVPLSGDRPSHWDGHHRQPRKARSYSAQRPVQHSRQRSHTTSTPDKPNRYPPNSGYNNRPPSQQLPNHRHRVSDGRSPHSRNNSTSDASSENSHLDHKGRHRDESPKRRKSSLWPPSFLRSHRRRHSSDAGTQKIEPAPTKQSIPLRPEYYHRKPQPQAPYAAAMPVHPPPSQRHPPGVRFRDHIFDDPNHSGPDSPVQPGMPPMRYPDPRSLPLQMDKLGPTVSRDSSSGSDRRHHSEYDHRQRAAGFPTRVATVSGVGGRKYPDPPVDPIHHNPSRVRGSAPTPV